MSIDYKILVPISITLSVILVSLIFRSILFKLLHKWSKQTALKVDDIVISSLKTPSIYFSIAIGLYIGIAFSELSKKYVYYANKAIYVFVIFAVTIAAANLAGRIFRYHVQKANLPISTSGLAYGILKGVIIVIGILVILSSLGISITPLITALGVGGLAVALALQDTLANLFSGMHILMERSIRIGDFIKLETGQEGYVEDITWRTTRVRMLPNNMVVIPNNKLAQSIVTNYYLPGKEMSVMIPVSVSYSSDPEKVEKILVEEAKNAANQIPGLLDKPEPSARLIGFGESSLDFTLNCSVQEFTDQYLVQHELRKKIFKRFQKENIEFPYPHRTVLLQDERQNRFGS